MATTKSKRKSKGRIGRPPRPNAADYRHVGFGLRLDLLAYAREKAVREHRSLSSALSDLIERGMGAEIQRGPSLPPVAAASGA